GGTARQSFRIDVAAAVRITGIDVTPEFTRFSPVGIDRPLTVTGTLSNGSSIDLTASPDTTYESSNPFVASVSAAGVAHAAANGNATITVHHRQFTDTAALVVEAG